MNDPDQLPRRVAAFEDAVVQFIHRKRQFAGSFGSGVDRTHQFWVMTFDADIGDLLENFWPLKVDKPRKVIADVFRGRASGLLPDAPDAFAGKLSDALLAQHFVRLR